MFYRLIQGKLQYVKAKRLLTIVLMGLMSAAILIWSRHNLTPSIISDANLRHVRDNASRARTSEAYGKLPLAFEINHAQTHERVKFLSRGNGFNLFLTETEAVLALNPKKTEGAVLRMQLVGANSKPQISGTDRLPGVSNYFIGDDPSKWRTNIPNYAKVHYKDVYHGIDLVYYGNQQQLEYDFVVSPNVDPKEIRLRFEGADKIEIDKQGDLLLHTEEGTIRQHKPIVYQNADGERQFIAANYAIKSKTEIGFDVAEYDAEKPLIIDPVLSYSTYLGGSSRDTGESMALDTAGNVYVAGGVTSIDFPTENPAQPNNGGGFDGYIAKLNSSGTALIYSTYLGGSGSDGGLKIAVDSTGNAYVTAITQSTDFPTTPGAFQTVFGGSAGQGGGGDAFVTKLNSSGAMLVYSTYLGGGGTDFALDIAVDSTGNAYIAGTTYSTNFPTTIGAFQTTPAGGNHDSFATKLNPTGSALVYSTYLGSSGDEQAIGIAVDSFSNAYVTGNTTSFNFPVTPGAFQTAFAGGNLDVWVTKFNSTGTALVYSTYVGGNSDDNYTTDSAHHIAVDSAGNAYITGQTPSTNFPTTPGAFQPVFAGGSGNLSGGDAFVTKLNATGDALVFSTYLGGDNDDFGRSIAVDQSGNVYVAGSTISTNFPTLDPLQVSNGGSQDGFVTKLNAEGSALVYSTYLGGSGLDLGNGIAADSIGNSYVSGATGSSDFPTANPFQANFGGGVFDAFAVKITDQIQTSAVDFFLHKSGSVLFLDNISPTAAIAQFKDSASLNFNGGNPWKEIGEWTAAPGSIPSSVTTLNSLSELHVWLGLKNSDDQGTRFDLRAEIYKNGLLIASGETFCITGVTRNPNLAKEATVVFGSISDGAISSTDELTLRVLTRIGTDGASGFCGGHSNAAGLRLYFDSVSRPAKFGSVFQ